VTLRGPALALAAAIGCAHAAATPAPVQGVVFSEPEVVVAARG